MLNRSVKLIHLFAHRKHDVKCRTCSTDKKQSSHKTFLHFSVLYTSSPCLRFPVFLGLFYLLPEFHSNMWVAAVWFFHCLEGAADPLHRARWWLVCVPQVQEVTDLFGLLYHTDQSSKEVHTFNICTSTAKIFRNSHTGQTNVLKSFQTTFLNREIKCTWKPLSIFDP